MKMKHISILVGRTLGRLLESSWQDEIEENGQRYKNDY